MKCKDFVRKTSSDEGSAFEKAQMFFHRLICIHCSNYFKQIGVIKLIVSKKVLDLRGSISKDEIKKIEEKILKSRRAK